MRQVYFDQGPKQEFTAAAISAGVEIRDFEHGDRAAIVSLWNRVFGYAEARNTPERVLDDKLRWDGKLLVAVADGVVVGTLMYGYDGHRGWLYRAAVLPEARRQGVGRRLVQAAEERLVALGCLKVNLQLHVHNDAGVLFWRALGYLDEARVSMGKDFAGSRA